MRPLAATSCALLLLLCPARAGRGAQEPSPAPAADLMDEVAEAFRALEGALQARDPAAAEAAAVSLGAVWERSGDLAPRARADARATFERLLSSARTATADLATAARAGELELASRSAEELRATCVRCHVGFRERTEDRLGYPARGGAIAGLVRVKTISGDERGDRSNVVVFLEGGPPAGPFAPPRRNPQVSQRGRRFEPPVLPVLRGTVVDFPNDDSVYHNVFSLSTAQPFDLGLYPQGSCRSVELARSGLVRVYCNLHPQMAASIVVLENPFFATTDADGAFVLPEVPAGEYTLRTWNEFGGEARATVTAAAGALLSLDLAFKEDTPKLEHKNKFGQPYHEKKY